jgi:peroxiredoxin
MLYLRNLALFVVVAGLIPAQSPEAQSPEAQSINSQLKNLRSLPDDTRARVTRDLALQIRALSAQSQAASKLDLALALAHLSTEGDFGRDTLQEVTTTLEEAMRESQTGSARAAGNDAYRELAELARYEHMRVTLDDPQYQSAMAGLEADDQARGKANFTLTDLAGNNWTLKDLRGKVVLVNFWATWCPPCRKEMPDLDALYDRFKSRGLVILAISDEEAATVRSFLTEHKVSYPILLDPGRTVTNLFRVEGIPKTFIYNPEGNLAAESIDMRTAKQFLEMLDAAGLH